MVKQIRNEIRANFTWEKKKYFEVQVRFGQKNILHNNNLDEFKTKQFSHVVENIACELSMSSNLLLQITEIDMLNKYKQIEYYAIEAFSVSWSLLIIS